jgi:hypothetical protein
VWLPTRWAAFFDGGCAAAAAVFVGGVVSTRAQAWGPCVCAWQYAYPSAAAAAVRIHQLYLTACVSGLRLIVPFFLLECCEAVDGVRVRAVCV